MQSMLASKLVLCLLTELQLCPMQVCSLLSVCMSLLQCAVSYMYSVQASMYLFYAGKCQEYVMSGAWRHHPRAAEHKCASGAYQCDECHNKFHCKLLTRVCVGYLSGIKAHSKLVAGSAAWLLLQHSEKRDDLSSTGRGYNVRCSVKAQAQ